VEVTPGGAVSDMLSHFNFLCPGQFVASGSRIQPATGACRTGSNQSCECTCDTVMDSARTYTIDVQPAVGATAQDTLHDGTPANVPTTSAFPQTAVGDNPRVSMVASAGSSVEFGAFDGAGRPIWCDNWRIFAHELCGHARLRQTQGGSRGCRQ